jgi:hypothetical protein
MIQSIIYIISSSFVTDLNNGLNFVIINNSIYLKGTTNVTKTYNGIPMINIEYKLDPDNDITITEQIPIGLNITIPLTSLSYIYKDLFYNNYYLYNFLIHIQYQLLDHLYLY